MMGTLTDILIATTSRVEMLDEGLVSRTDLVIHFERSPRTLRQIWVDGTIAPGNQNCLTEADVDTIIEMTRDQLDGHTITSIIQSASRIARNENRNIQVADIVPYLEAWIAFSSYLHNLHRLGSFDRVFHKSRPIDNKTNPEHAE